jgi:hypothetical protein
VGIATGAHVALLNAVDEMNASFHTANAYGCYGAAAECNRYNDARASARTAATVVDWAIATTGVIAVGLLAAALWGEVTAPAQVEVAASVGGVVVRGTF